MTQRSGRRRAVTEGWLFFFRTLAELTDPEHVALISYARKRPKTPPAPLTPALVSFVSASLGRDSDVSPHQRCRALRAAGP